MLWVAFRADVFGRAPEKTEVRKACEALPEWVDREGNVHFRVRV
jgi:hypothetical protein